MKRKLNKKGFTLVELLAVIVVLAIILVITVPTVLNSISSTRQDALQSSANSVAKYVEEQISLATLGKNEILNGDSVDKVYFDSDGNLCASKSTGTVTTGSSVTCNNVTSITLDGDGANFDTYAVAISSLTTSKAKLGLNDTDYDLANSKIAWDSKGNVTVVLKGKTDGGKFKGLEATSNN